MTWMVVSFGVVISLAVAIVITVERLLRSIEKDAAKDQKQHERNDEDFGRPQQ